MRQGLPAEPRWLWRQLCQALGLDPESTYHIEAQRGQDGSVQLRADRYFPAGKGVASSVPPPHHVSR